MITVSEIFRSRQGEGRLTCVESIFVRACGCPLRCRYCDTPYTSWQPGGEELSVEAIVGRMLELSRETEGDTVRHAVLTGGEPMLFADLIPLCQQLRDQRWHVTVETAGTLFLPLACDLMSISPKLSNSMPTATDHPHEAARHEVRRSRPEVVRRLIAAYDYQVKFVVDRPDDLPEIEAYLAAVPEIDRRRAMLMPLGTTVAELANRAAWVEPYCAEHGLQFCPRRQIEWYGPGRGV